MTRFVLRYRGSELEKAKQELAAIRGVVLIEASGRNFLVECEPDQIESALGDSARWAMSAETITPLPKPPRAKLNKPGGRA
jgi:hypothetical protein